LVSHSRIIIDFKISSKDVDLKGGEYLINVGDIVDVTEKFGKENNWVVLYLFQPVEMFKDAFPEGK